MILLASTRPRRRHPPARGAGAPSARRVEIRDFSYAQAAADLGVGPSNMKMIVFRARKRIRAEIARRLGSASAPVRRRIAV
jgi:hypothetical protein